MAAHTWRAVPPIRFERIGGPAAAAVTGPVDATTAAQAPPAVSAGASSPTDVAGAVSGFLGDAVTAGQVVLGGGLLVVALILLVSQTSAGAGAGRAAAGGARRAARFIPGVGALV